MDTKTHLLVHETHLENLEEAYERMEHLREQLLDLIHKAKSATKFKVTEPRPYRPLTFPSQPPPEELIKIF